MEVTPDPAGALHLGVGLPRLPPPAAHLPCGGGLVEQVFGWPTGSVGLPQGYYVFDGEHVVRFPRERPRRLVRDHGTETDVCALLR